MTGLEIMALVGVAVALIAFYGSYHYIGLALHAKTGADRDRLGMAAVGCTFFCLCGVVIWVMAVILNVATRL